MRVLAWILVTIGGAVVLGQWGGGPWALAWVALCVAFAFTARKLTVSDALRLWAMVLFILAVIIGGMVVVEQRYGGFAAGVWLVVCLLLLMVLRRRLIRAVPLLHLATTFHEVVDPQPKERSSTLIGCLGFFGFLAGMMLFIALWGTAGGVAWFALLVVALYFLMAADRRRSGRPSGDDES
jgi:hypothetical protein